MLEQRSAVSKDRETMEHDPNDQIQVGTYKTKHFEISKDAQKLLSMGIPKEADEVAAEHMAIHHDKLFDLVKQAMVKKRTTPEDVEAAENHVERIKSLAKDVGIEDNKVDYLKTHLDKIKQHVDTDTSNHIDPEELEKEMEKRYTSKPTEYSQEPRDFDIDNTKNFVKRSIAAQRKLKVIDDEFNPEGKEMDSKKLGLPESLIAAVAEIMKKEEVDQLDEKLVGNQHEIDANKNGKIDSHDFKLLRSKKKVAKEEVEEIEEGFVIHKGKHEPGTKSSLGGQTLHGVTVKDVYTDKKEAQAHADKINAGRGYKPGDDKNSLYGGVLYQVSPAKSMKEEAEQISEGPQRDATRAMNKLKDAVRGANYKKTGMPVPDPDPKHKTAQAHNKAIGRALRKEDSDVLSAEEQERLDAIWASLEEGRRGRPPKDPEARAKWETADTEEPDQHIINQLKKAADSEDKPFHVAFKNGKKHPVHHTDAKKLVKKYMGMKPADKETFQNKIEKSHEDMKSEL